jgi:hypothetical protein
MYLIILIGHGLEEFLLSLGFRLKDEIHASHEE